MELTRDDERARRICSLALDFMNATGPLSSSDIARTHYPELSSDSFRRAFSRDREMLAACGVVVRDRKGPSGESLWEADDERSFARGAELSPTDAAALEVSCRPLVEDPSFPLADSLRYALAKLAAKYKKPVWIFCGNSDIDESGLAKMGLSNVKIGRLAPLAANQLEALNRAPKYLAQLTKDFVSAM